MLKAYKYRLYPTQEQRDFLAQTFGNVRKVYNLALDMRCIFWNGAGQSVSRFATQSQLVGWKEMYPYLELSNSQSLQYAVKQVDDAFTNWWKNGARHPLPKRRRDRQSFHNPQNCSVDWQRKTLTIPKCKDVPIVLHRPFYGTIKDVTVSLDPDGRYFASILVDSQQTKLPCSPIEEATTIGGDTGIRHMFTVSDRRVFEPLHAMKKQAEMLERCQRQLRRKEKGSKNREKLNRRIAKIYSRAVNRRNDYIHKITYMLTHDSQVRTICIEDLDIRQWMKDERIAYGAADVAIGRFYDVLRYKCEWYGVNLVKIGRWDASSKTCSVCGTVNHSLKRSDEHWTCICCGTYHDRDYNASINIKNFGLRQTLPGDDREVTPVDCSTVDDRRLAGLRSSDRTKQEKFRSVTDAPAL